MIKRFFVLLLIICAVSVVTYGDGAGGAYFGFQTSKYPFLDNYDITGNTLGLVYYGGYGYGVSYYNNTIAGGFGYAIMDVDGETGIAGGFGGFLTGYRIIDFPINLTLMSWTGLGGIYTGTYEGAEGKGFFCISEEITVELGIPLLGWFMPTVFAGYQVTASLIPGRPFSTFLSYTPVIGLRLQWGDFY